MSYGIHWFRRDLRVAGNKALRHNFQKNKGRVLCVFTFDKKFLSRDDFSANRFQFFLETMKALKTELNELGGDLITLDVGPEQAFEDFLSKMKKENNLPSLITWNRDYEPYAVDRDARMKTTFEGYGVETADFRDHLIIEPHELTKPTSNEGYQVFTPFSRRWMDIYSGDDFRKRVGEQKKSFEYLDKKPKEKIFNLNSIKKVVSSLPKDILEVYATENQKNVTVPIPEAGFEAACKRLDEFKDKVDLYDEDRDFPELEGTSGLSIYFKNGSLTTSQAVYRLGLNRYKKKTTSKDTYYSEIVWREFYYHVLKRRPSVETQEFKPQYAGLKWDNDKVLFQKWKDGMTGFPFVDAGMRELKKTGLMHNRVRMVVASFLTKDLLIDWRWGEKYFMEMLLDGDMAPNNGGWQWAASTGCDAQPYFRIFNPFSQGKRFDAKGAYIKKYVPELADVDAKKLHAPILGHSSYPEPIVEHSEQRDKALALYKSAK